MLKEDKWQLGGIVSHPSQQLGGIVSHPSQLLSPPTHPWVDIVVPTISLSRLRNIGG